MRGRTRGGGTCTGPSHGHRLNSHDVSHADQTDAHGFTETNLTQAPKFHACLHREDTITSKPRHQPIHATRIRTHTQSTRGKWSQCLCLRAVDPSSVLDDILILSSYSLSIHPVLLQSSPPPLYSLSLSPLPLPPSVPPSFDVPCAWRVGDSESHRINLQHQNTHNKLGHGTAASAPHPTAHQSSKKEDLSEECT